MLQMIRLKVPLLLLISGIVFPNPSEALSQESPANRFRGNQGLGAYEECSVGIPWKDQSISKVDLPGIGNGSPVLWQDSANGSRAYVLSASATDATRHVIAIDLANNKVLWTTSYPSAKHRLHQFTTYASSTPAVDQNGIYVAWGEPEHVYVKHLGHDGQERWTRDFGRYVSQHGFATSPMLLDGKLYLLDSQDAEELEAGVAPGEDRMLALDAKTGQTLWERKLPTKRVCYGLPSVRTLADGSKELVCATTAMGIFGMDPSTGEIRWNHDCFKQRVCSSTLLVGPLAIATHGSGGGRDNMLVAYDMDAKKERFRIQRAAPYVPTAVAKGDLLFLWSDAGIVSCVRLDEGQVLWSERIGGNFFSSPILVGNRLLNVSDTGNVTILAAGDKFEKIATISTDETVRSTLVASQDMLLLRTYEQLWIIR